MKNKTVVLVINDEYYNSDEAKLTERIILKHLGGDHRIMKMSFTFFTEKGFYAIPFNTTLVAFVIKKSERKICDNLLYKYIPMTARVYFYYIGNKERKEEKKDMENKRGVVEYAKIKQVKETIDDLMANHTELKAIETEFESNDIARGYLETANKLSFDDSNHYVYAINLMTKEIEACKKALEYYTVQNYNNSKEDLENLQKENEILRLENDELKRKISQVVELIRGELHG